MTTSGAVVCQTCALRPDMKTLDQKMKHPKQKTKDLRVENILSSPTEKFRIEAPHRNSGQALPLKVELEIRSGISFPMESMNNVSCSNQNRRSASVSDRAHALGSAVNE